MQLPGDSIGITDIISYRECPRRMSYGMKRHVGRAQQSEEGLPDRFASSSDPTGQRVSYASHYGAAIHEAIQLVEEGATVEEAIQAAWNKYGRQLEPGDVQLLREDLEIYEARDFPGTRTVAAEDEFRVPLFRYKGRQIYFRFKLDRLYERIGSPGTFIHIDYKSSRHAKSKEEVHKDKQMWAYNFGVHEFWPECDQLIQVYDQLRYGQEPTGKSPKQREQIKEWLIKQVTAILEDTDVRDDGLLAPTKNDWCAWCPIMMDCPVIPQLSDYARTKIAVLAPRTPKLKKNGEPSKVMQDVPLDPARIAEYVEQFADAKHAMKVLDRFTKEVAGLLRDVPDARREELGYTLREKTVTSFSTEAKRSLLEKLGVDAFCALAGITQTGLKDWFGDDEESFEWALGLAEKQKGAPSVVEA